MSVLSKASKIGLYALVEMASHPGTRLSASDVARRFGVSEHHVAKVLQSLARAELLGSVRGARGGYQLQRAPDQITMLDVVRHIEGPLVTNACADCPFRQEGGDCHEDASTCRVHTLLNRMGTHLEKTLAAVTIEALASDKEIPP